MRNLDLRKILGVTNIFLKSRFVCTWDDQDPRFIMSQGPKFDYIFKNVGQKNCQIQALKNLGHNSQTMSIIQYQRASEAKKKKAKKTSRPFRSSGHSSSSRSGQRSTHLNRLKKVTYRLGAFTNYVKIYEQFLTMYLLESIQSEVTPSAIQSF